MWMTISWSSMLPLLLKHTLRLHSICKQYSPPRFLSLYLVLFLCRLQDPLPHPLGNLVLSAYKALRTNIFTWSTIWPNLQSEKCAFLVKIFPLSLGWSQDPDGTRAWLLNITAKSLVLIPLHLGLWHSIILQARANQWFELAAWLIMVGLQWFEVWAGKL